MIEFYGGYQVYSESGIDLTLLRENLKRSIEERIENNARAVEFMDAIKPGAQVDSSGGPNHVGGSLMFDAPTILRQLNDHQVKYVLIGGIAMRAQGSAHVTDDLDICYSRSPDNVRKLAEALEPLHPYLRGAPMGLPFRLDAPTILAGLNFTLTTDRGSLDVLGEVKGIGTFEQVDAQSEPRTMFGLPVRVLSLDGLLASKKAAGRLKDRNHILELEELKKMRDAAHEG